MAPQAIETAEFLKFMDNLFDSVNGFQKFDKGGKILKTRVNCVETETCHTKFWKSAIKILSTFRCENKNKFLRHSKTGFQH